MGKLCQLSWYITSNLKNKKGETCNSRLTYPKRLNPQTEGRFDNTIYEKHSHNTSTKSKDPCGQILDRLGGNNQEVNVTLCFYCGGSTTGLEPVTR